MKGSTYHKVTEEGQESGYKCKDSHKNGPASIRLLGRVDNCQALNIFHTAESWPSILVNDTQ